HEMKAPAHFRIVLDSGDRRHFPVAEVTGQHEDALAATKRVDEDVEAVDVHERALALARKPAEAHELGHELPQMRVMRLRQPVDLTGRHCATEHAPQIVDDHLAAY